MKYLIAIAALVLLIGLPAQASAQMFENMKQCDDLGPVAFETGPFQKFWGAAVGVLFGEPKQVHLVRCVDDFAACYFMARIKTPDGRNRRALEEDPEFIGMTKAKAEGEFSCVALAAASLPPAGGGNGHCCSKCAPSGHGDWDSDHCKH